MTLSHEQRRAVERTGQNVCVVAGPGSGKTRVLVERFAWLVENCGVDPGRILAITFTERAATEMKSRLTTRLPERRQEVERAWVATIDAFCMGVLRENCIATGLPPDFTVLDPAAAARMERDAAEAALDAMFVDRPGEMRRLMEALDLSTDDGGRRPDLAASLLEVYETMRLSGVRELPEAQGCADVFAEARELARAIRDDPTWSESHAWAADFLALAAEPVAREHFAVLGKFEVNLGRGSKKAAGHRAAKELKQRVLLKLEAQWVQAWYAGLPELLRLSIERLDGEYREAKRREAATDFADLEEKLIELLEGDAAVRARVQNQFEHVLMDELQDTNRLQWRLVNLVRGTKAVFFAVGDINQSVYAFRHADRTVFQEYRAAVRESGGAVDELEENYRSREEILAAVSEALDGQPGIESRTLTAKGKFSPAETPVERLVGIGERREEVEASLVARRICELSRETEYKLSDFAILVRTFNSTGPFERALDRCGIPFVVSGGKTFLEARETRDLMALLAALVNPLDEIALVGVLRSPLAGWSDEQLLQAGQEGRQREFEKLFGRLRKLAGFVAPDRLLAMALDECGYAAQLLERAVSNIGKLLAWLRREHRRRPRPLAELLEELESLRKSQAEAEAPPSEAADAVRIFTMHTAKGLEFPVVFVGALQRGIDNRGRAILFSAEHGLGVKWRNPVTGKGVSDAAHKALEDLQRVEEKEEASRLLYVAMTRAEDRLVLSYSSRNPRSSSAWVKRAEAAVAAATETDSVVESKLERRGAGSAETQMLERARVGEQYDSSASVTSLALFDACPRKYYLARYLGLEAEPDGAGTGAMELGTEVHKALAGGSTDSVEARELAARFEHGALGLRAARASRKEREFDFLLPVEDVILRGYIDLWFEEGGELVLVDYKTDRDESRAGEYALQLRIYALALERYAGRVPERAALCYLKSEHEVNVGLSAGELDAAKASVRALRDAQDSLEFPMKVGEQCRRCSFYGGLCGAEI